MKFSVDECNACWGKWNVSYMYVCIVNKIQIYKSSVKIWLSNAQQSNKNLKVKNPSKGVENKIENAITQLCTCILNISCTALTSLSLKKINKISK